MKMNDMGELVHACTMYVRYYKPSQVGSSTGNIFIPGIGGVPLAKKGCTILAPKKSVHVSRALIISHRFK